MEDVEAIVMSTRARLARNLSDVPFPRMIRKTARGEAVIERAKEALPESFRLVRMNELSKLQRAKYVEQHKISAELAGYEDGALFSAKNIQIMVMEEDHFRLQCILPGLKIKEALAGAQEAEKTLGERMKFAYDAQLGYLTSCLTNVGTGLRMSAMLHLPALTQSGAMSGVIASIEKVGITVRGTFGEGTQALGAVYQISNQTTLGMTEEEIAKRVESIITQILEKEREVRNALIEQDELSVKDAVMRSVGCLRYARKMTYSEALRLLSALNLGVSAKMIENISHESIYRAMHDVLPATMSGPQEEERRAALLRERFA